MIALPHRIPPHRREATGIISWIGQLNASVGTCVRRLSGREFCGRNALQLWSGQFHVPLLTPPKRRVGGGARHRHTTQEPAEGSPSSAGSCVPAIGYPLS